MPGGPPPEPLQRAGSRRVEVHTGRSLPAAPRARGPPRRAPWTFPGDWRRCEPGGIAAWWRHLPARTPALTQAGHQNTRQDSLRRLNRAEAAGAEAVASLVQRVELPTSCLRCGEASRAPGACAVYLSGIESILIPLLVGHLGGLNTGLAAGQIRRGRTLAAGPTRSKLARGYWSGVRPLR